ncbi:MAG: hypothetical protein WCO56_24930 [Verrucomicrobiota bacterium]
MEFEQLPKESAKAFAAFSLYLNMGAQRSTQAVAKQLAKSEQLIRRWSARYGWTARVQAHGAHLAMVERQATEVAARSKAAEWLARQVEHREEEWRIRNELVEAGREALRRWKENPQRCGSLEGIARMLELASKLGRLASGMPTDHTEVTGEITVTVDVEWEMALKKVYGKEPPAKIIDVDAASKQ